MVFLKDGGVCLCIIGSDSCYQQIKEMFTFAGIRYSLRRGKLRFLLLLLFVDDTGSCVCAFRRRERDGLSRSIDGVSK
jgi:hypothetical protein